MILLRELSLRFETLLLAGLICSCSGPTQTVQVTSPFNASLEGVFDNGADFVVDPEPLAGPWLAEWEESIDKRVTYADSITLFRVETLRNDTNLDRVNTLRLLGHIEKQRIGQIPTEQTLTVNEHQPGYASIAGNEEKLLQKLFLLFIKWTHDEHGHVVPRWHLSPGTDKVVRRVNSLVEMNRGDNERRRRVVVHQSPN